MQRHNYPLRRPSPNKSTEDKARGAKRVKSNHHLSKPEFRSRYRGDCKYELGFKTSVDGTFTPWKQEDRVICDKTELEKFCGNIKQHGYLGARADCGREHIPNAFFEGVKAGAVDIAAGDRVLVVFSPIPSNKKLRVFEVVCRDQGGFCVRFTRPNEIPRQQFEVGYGSFSLAIIRAPGSTAEDFEFVEVDETAAENANDYVVRYEGENDGDTDDAGDADDADVASKKRNQDVDAINISKMSYLELKQTCKSKGLLTRGKADILKRRLLKWLDDKDNDDDDDGEEDENKSDEKDNEGK